MLQHFYKDVFCLFLFFAVVFLTISCGKNSQERKEVVFQLCQKEELPDELVRLIEEKKEKEFQLVYENSAYLYLVVGYGKQKSEEYVAVLEEIYELEKGIMVDTTLIHQTYAKDKTAGKPEECPYIVIRFEEKEKQVFFLK